MRTIFDDEINSAAKGAAGRAGALVVWERRRGEILSAMQTVMGPLPDDTKRQALDVRIEEETDCGPYVRRFVTYAAEPNCRTPAFLLIPRAALREGAKLSAALALHSTDMELGHKVVVGLGRKPNRAYGHELAVRGYVVLAPAYPLMADYWPDLKSLGYESGTMKAVWDNMRGLDLLDSLPFVKAGAYGCIGHSLGGHNAIFTAVFDARIKAVVSSCGFDSFLDYMGGDIAGWTQERYMPRLAKLRPEEVPFDFHEMIASLAPRHCFVSAPIKDDNFRWESVSRIIGAARTVYDLYGESDRLRVEHPDCDHDFPEAVRERAYSFLDEACGITSQRNDLPAVSS
jgi:hypothetical protein